MKEFKKNIKFVWKYAKREKLRIFFYVFLTIVSIATSIVFPIIGAKRVIYLTNNQVKQFFLIAVILTVLFLINDLVIMLKNKIYQKVFRNIYSDLQTDLGYEILKLSNKSLEENSSGAFIQRLNGDTKTISSIFVDMGLQLNGIISNIGIFVTIFIISRTFFYICFASMFIRFLIEKVRISIWAENDKKYKENNDKLTGFSSEIIRGAEDIKMLNGEDSFIAKLRSLFKENNEERFKMQNVDFTYRFIRASWVEISGLAKMYVLGISLLNGSLEVASAMVLYNFSSQVNSLSNYMTTFIELITNFNVSATRIFDIFAGDKYEKEKFGKKHLDKVEGNFEFKNVSFKYDKVPVLSDMSFKVKANETVAFVGKSGAGKTTLFNLLCKMYDNYKGTITIDGVDIKKLDKNSIRGNITIVSQSPYIFNMSIKENLKLVKKDLTDEEMIEACKMACLDEYIDGLPDKYDTIIGEGGVNLSGGQKQRLAIARAFVQKTEIILFDEATSALDNETQTEIQKAIDNLQKDYTILIIAHRLSTIKNADRILFIDDGKVIAEGSHEKLLKKCKQYKELYENEITKIGEK